MFLFETEKEKIGKKGREELKLIYILKHTIGNHTNVLFFINY